VTTLAARSRILPFGIALGRCHTLWHPSSSAPAGREASVYLFANRKPACHCTPRAPRWHRLAWAEQSVGEAIGKLNTERALRLRTLLTYEEHVIVATHFSSQNSRKMTSLIAGRALAFLLAEKWEVPCPKQYFKNRSMRAHSPKNRWPSPSL